LSTAEKSVGRKATAEKAGMEDSEVKKFARIVTVERTGKNDSEAKGL